MRSEQGADSHLLDAGSGAVRVVRHPSVPDQRTEDDPLHQGHRARLRTPRQHARAGQPRANDSTGTRPADRDVQSAPAERRRTAGDAAQASTGVGAAAQGSQGHHRQQDARQAHREPARRDALRRADTDPPRGLRRRRDQRFRHSRDQQAEVRAARYRRRASLRIRHAIVRQRGRPRRT